MNIKKYALIRMLISWGILAISALIFVFVFIKQDEPNVFVGIILMIAFLISGTAATMYRILLTNSFAGAKLSDGSVVKVNDECINGQRLDNIFLGDKLLVYFSGVNLNYLDRYLIEDVEDNGKWIVLKHRSKTIGGMLKGIFKKTDDIDDTKIIDFKIRKKNINTDYVYEIKSWLNNKAPMASPTNLYENKVEGEYKFMNNEKKMSMPMIVGIFAASILVIGLCGYVVYSKFSKENNIVNNQGYTFDQYKSDLFAYTEENSFVEYLIDANDKADNSVSIDILDGEKDNEYILFVSNDGKQAYSSFIDVVDADGNDILNSGVSLLKPNDYFYSKFESDVEPYDYVVSNEVYSISTFGDYQTSYDAYWSQTSDGSFCISIILSESDLNYDTVVGIAKNYFSYNSIMGLNGDKLYFLDASLTHDDLVGVKNEDLDALYDEHAVYIAQINIDDNNISIYDKIYSDNTLIDSIIVE